MNAKSVTGIYIPINKPQSGEDTNCLWQLLELVS